jgi:hypothetical protein
MRRTWQQASVVLGPALLAAALALLAHLFGLRGGDQAAQAYRVGEVRVYGLVLWDSGWYGGNLPMGYSVAFPLLGAAVGLLAVGVASAAVATWAFDRLVVAGWGRRGVASWYFAVSTMLQVAIGQLPFLCGESFGLLALLALRHRRNKVAVALMASSALCSPLAAVFTALACLAWALDHQDRLVPFLVRHAPRGTGGPAGTPRVTPARHRAPGPLPALATGAVALAVILAIDLLFPGSGPFPYRWGALVLTLLLCATLATPLVPANPVLRWGAGLYALAAVGAFVVPNAVGGNAARLAQAIGVPLLAGLLCLRDPSAAGATLPRSALGARRDRERQSGPSRADGLARRAWRAAGDLGPSGRGPRALRVLAIVVVLGGFATWQWGPGLDVLDSPQTDAAASPKFYQPLLDEILSRSDGPVRVEAVPTKNHWESAYLAPKVSLARGWERQLDLADNPLFYRPGALTASSYLAWLHRNGVTWVALPNTSLDYASRGEAALLERGPLPDLTLVWASRQWHLWRVDGSPGLLSGPGHLVTLDPDHMTLAVTRPSVLTLRVRYTNLWDLPDVDHGTATACVLPGPDGWTDVIASRQGRLDLAISVFDGRSANCPSR